jgi:hypothetical protein
MFAGIGYMSIGLCHRIHPAWGRNSVQLVAGPTASQLIEIEKFSGLRAPNARRSAARA